MALQISGTNVVDNSRNASLVGCTVSSTSFKVPSGSGAQRPASPTTGTIRFNTDFNVFEIYVTSEWRAIQFGSTVPLDSQIARGVFGGGLYPSTLNVLDYITIGWLGNALDFGDLTVNRDYLAACSSSTRGVFGGGSPSGNTIDYITIASTGNATDFGDLTAQRPILAACSSSTRGVFGGGTAPQEVTYNILDYITIASTGNATNFGDLTVSRDRLAACSSSTRGVFGGGFSGLSSFITYNILDYITIASTGNATDFGDLTVSRYSLAACSSSTRGVFGGGVSPSIVNVLDYITIASTGNATNFGDLTVSRYGLAACSSSTMGTFGGGSPSANTIDYITIASTGNATNFGDLTVSRRYLAACSNGHGGL